MEKFDKKDAYEFCEIRNIMVKLTVIRSTAILPDMVHSEAKLVPVDCSNAKECRKRKVPCIVYDPAGLDPCPGAWQG